MVQFRDCGKAGSGSPLSGEGIVSVLDLESKVKSETNSIAAFVNRHAALVGSAAISVSVLYLLIISQQRLVDPDEGFYTVASKLVAENEIPYVDFFYQQAPLLPFVYGLWIKVFGASWLSVRMLSALIAAATGALIYSYIHRETRSVLTASAALALFVSSGLVATWFPIVKTFALAALFVVGCFTALCWPPVRLGPFRLGFAGCLLGLAGATRIFLVILAPIFLVWIVVQSRTRNAALANAAWFLFGCAIGFSPCLALFVYSPDVFLFNNLGYHALRTPSGLIGAWEQKFRTLFHLLYLSEDAGLQLTALATVSGLIFFYPRGAGLLAFAVAVALGIVSLLPTPTYTQYFSLCMPFLIVSATLGAFEFFATANLSPAARRRLNLAAAAGIAAFALSAIPSLAFYLRACDQSPARIREVSKAIDRLAAPGEPVISIWPGFLFECQAKVVPPFGNDYGWEAGWQVSPEARLKYKVGDPYKMGEFFNGRTSRIVVFGNDIIFRDSASFGAALRRAGYHSVATFGDTDIFVLDQ
jgi:hypothetical protein